MSFKLANALEMRGHFVSISEKMATCSAFRLLPRFALKWFFPNLVVDQSKKKMLLKMFV